MSEEVVANATEVAANAEPTKTEVQQGDSSSELNTERILAESKEWKKKYQAVKSEKEAAEKSKLQEQAKYKELYEKADVKYQTLYKTLVKEKVKAAVTDVASKAGCVSVDDLLKLGDVQLLQVDDESLEVQGVSTFVDEAKKNKPYLFTANKSQTINSATPGGLLKGSQKTIKEMTKEEILAELRSLK